MSTLIIYDRFRFERAKSTAFDWFTSHALPPNANVTYRLHDDHSAIPNDVDRILLLGSKALTTWTTKTSIFTENCYPQVITAGSRPIPAIATFHPQDAYDFKLDIEDEHFKSQDDFKDFTVTAPSNWMFWIKVACAKLITEGPRPPIGFTPRLYPPLREACDALDAAKDCNLYLDIETRRSDQGLNCIGFAINDGPVYVVPIYRYTDQVAYEDIHLFYRALARAFVRNTLVLHNAGFDLVVLSALYRMGFGQRIYDTLVAQHRCYPEAEKSLAHAMALWTWQPFHKDQGGYPHNRDQENRYWLYNARDVHGTRLVHKSQLKYIEKDAGLMASIEQAMSSLSDYMTMTVAGIKVNEHQLAVQRWINQRKLTQYARVIDVLAGQRFNALSSVQCVNYFHKRLGYKPVARSKESGNPSLDAKALYKLRLQNNNPLIDAILRYRECAKEQSMLDFTPWPFPKL